MQNSGLTICVPQQKLSFIGPDYIFPVFSWPLLVSLCPLQPHICLCGRQEGSPARPSAAEHNFHFEILFCSPKLASTFCQLQLVIKGQHLTKKKKKKKKKRSKTHASKSWEIGSFRETQTIWHYQHRQ